MPSHPDPLMPDAVEAYFRHFYWSQTHLWDKYGVLQLLADDLRRPELALLKFRTAAQKYRFIREEQTPILVPYDQTARGIRDRLLRGGEADFSLVRGAQRYLVGVWKNMLDTMLARGLLVEHDSGLFLLINEQAYSPEKGVSFEAAGFDPGLLIQ
jgi:hypothetical protein